MKFKALYEYPQTPMTEEISGYFIRAILMEQQGNEFEGLEEHAYARMIKNRLNVASITISNPLWLFVTALCENPAHCTMYAYALYCIAKKDNIKHITTTEFVYAFANGFPNEEQLDIAWRDQKIESESFGGNGLDLAETWNYVL